MLTHEPSTPDQTNLGHWHPASRPDTERISQPDAEEQLEHYAPVTKGNLPEPVQGLEDFESEDAPDAIIVRAIPELQQEGGQQAHHDGPSGQLLYAGENISTAPRTVSFAPKPASATTFEPPNLPSDEDEERLDPAWGIKRTDSAQILQSINRSTSFPSFVEPLAVSETANDAPLPHSQAEDIMQHMESEAASGFGDKEEHLPEQVDDAANEDWARSANDFAEDTQSRGPESQPITDMEVRFEEGVPLISPDPQVESEETSTNQGQQQVTSNPFETYEEKDSFFDNFGAQQQVHQPPLDRKTTSDFLDGLENHHDEPSDSPTRLLSRAGTFEAVTVGDDAVAAAGSSHMDNPEESKNGADDPWAAALDDDGFLIDDDDDLLPDSAPDSPSSFNALLKADAVEPDEFLTHLHEEPPVQKTPPSSGRGQRPDFARNPSSNPYTPHQPSTSDLAQLSPTTFGNVGFSRPALAPMNSFQQQLQQRPVPPQKTESFVDQKGAYKSPYDLPMEIAKPRKRQQIQQPVQPNTNMPPPPPRTSSMSSGQGLQSPFSPTFPPGQGLTMPPPSSRPTPGSATVAFPPKPPSASRSSFFEELPITSRPRPPTGQGRYTPQQNTSIPRPQLLPQSPPSMHSQLSPTQPAADPYAQYQLRAPEKLDPYANLPLQVPSAPANPITNTRYSPNPTAAVGAIRPSPSPRYSPAPPPQAAAGRYAAQPTAGSAGPPQPARYTPQPQVNIQSSAASLAFQPRTSSPLAYMGRSISEQTEQPPQPQPGPSQYESNTLPTRYAPQLVQRNATPPPVSQLAPTRRPQTQSPGKKRVPPSLQALVNGDYQRPASVPGQISPTRGPPVDIAPPARPSVRQRGMTGNFNFIEPNDGQQHDQLQRWKGAPILNFAFGGSVVNSFPKHVPRYAMGSAAPMIKSSAGEVRVRNATEIVPVPEHIISFPGPLRSKSKKKDVLAWLRARITALEQEHQYRSSQTQLPDPHKRHDEKVLLWKVVQALVEHDGVLEGTSATQKTLGTILSPEVYSLDDISTTPYGAGADTSGIYRPIGISSRTETVDPDAVESLRKHLLRGEREKAVWTAVDKRLWSHALLMASTLEATVWKQVVQEFVRQEVKIIGNNTESLAALYEIFAGNFEESVDELVPPSARAGLQMVSKVDSSGPTKNALDGLDRWRETLSLVLSNRTNNDVQALVALGGLLMSYGRVEAAHICHLFARNQSQPALFGGADEPNAGVVLLGADHRTQPTEFFRDEDAILLTEVYEFAVCLLGGNSLLSMPHLQVYKLQRASWMADSGRKAEAQAYCEAIAGSFKASTKMSPYYNPAFFAELEELSSRLKNVPVQSSSSWSKPSVEKVTNSLFNRLGNFIAGDDSDADSKGSGKDVNHEFGPFANVTGTPSLSRTGSSTDLYGTYPSSMPPAPSTAAGTRYAPNGANTARSSSELTRGRPSFDSQRSPPSSGPSPLPRPNPYEQSASFGQPSHLGSQSNMYQPMSQLPSVNQYQATPPQTSYMAQAARESPHRSYVPQQQDSYIPTPPPEPVQSSYIPATQESESQPSYTQQPSFGGYAPPEQQPEPDSSQPAPSNGYELRKQSYGGYEPPTGYVPYEPEPESAEEKTDAPRKKSYMDDDDDDFPRVSENPSNDTPPSTAPAPVTTSVEDDAAARKRVNDAAADAAFRAAAEADALKAKEEKTLKPKASGWFSVPSVPFFGGKKDSLDAPAAKGSEPKVHRANLGESKMSIYYDDKLKKWVNPADPESMKPKAGPPPPPMRGPTPRVLTPSATLPKLRSSAGMGSGSGPPSRQGTPAEKENVSAAGPGTGTPPPLAGGVAHLASGPPSRPSTGQSGGGNDLDDLLGSATGGGRRTVKGKKGGKGRYIDIMAK